MILSCTFVLFPLVGLALSPLRFVLGDGLYMGILFLTFVPSTVQASIAFTSIAGGNVAAAIVSASLSSIVGVVATPLLAMLLMNTGHIEFSGTVFLDRHSAVLAVRARSADAPLGGGIRQEADHQVA